MKTDIVISWAKGVILMLKVHPPVKLDKWAIPYMQRLIDEYRKKEEVSMGNNKSYIMGEVVYDEKVE